MFKGRLPEAEVLKCLIEELYAAESRSDAFRAFTCAMDHLGFGGAMLVSRVSGPGWDEAIAETTYPDAWVEHYLASGYQRSDPTRRYRTSMGRAFPWSDLYPLIRKKEMRIFHEAREFGLASGVSIQLFDGATRVGGIGIASSYAEVGVPRLLTTLEIACQAFLAVYEEIVRREVGISLEPSTAESRLTKAEHLVLSHMCRGATNSEIADGLHVSVNAVEFHVRNLLQKLKAKNRVAAVVTAIKLGIVEPE